MIENVRELLTKKGDRMAFVMLGDGTDTIELVAFPETYRANHDVFTVGSCIALTGKLSMRNEEPTIVVERIKNLV